MRSIFIALLLASALHMAEEYAYPGGFPRLMKRLNPSFAPFVTTSMALVGNGLQLLLCCVAIWTEPICLTFSMSVAALTLLNGLIHIAACVKIKGYAPGVITGVALYLPLSAYAYCLAISAGRLGGRQIAVTMALGLLYQAAPPIYLLTARAIKRSSTHA